eukprot:7860342-Alexandrium_andersonii.AAC.1
MIEQHTGGRQRNKRGAKDSAGARSSAQESVGERKRAEANAGNAGGRPASRGQAGGRAPLQEDKYKNGRED